MADKPPTITDQPKSSIAFDKTGMSISHTSPFNSQFTSSLSSFHQSPHHPVNSQPFQRNQMPLTSPSTSNSAAPAPIASMASNSITVADRPLVPMGPPPAKEMKKFDINSLMSPPDPVQDSFHVGRSNFQPISMARSESNPSSMAMVMGAGKTQQHSSKHPLPMSPPISPYSHHVTHSNATTPPSHSIRDPVLYPIEDGSPSSPPHQPLFGPAELEDHQRIVENHVRARSTDWFGRVAPPKHEDYALVLSFRSHVMKKYSADRKGWLRKEREFLEADRKAGAQRYHHIMPAKPIVVKPARSIKGDRISKPSGSQAPRSARANGTATPATARSAARRVSATPEPSRRIVAPNREDKDFNSLRDLCPPLASLPNRPNSLKVDWKGQPLDLSHDPHVHLLHPDEIALAGGLRLDCATYLTSKRRIFERRLQCLRIGKDFRKTDAQQACKIDVNKASKLWTAFDKVGWLDAHWVRRFL